MKCIYCDSNKVHKNGIARGYQRYKCLSCKRSFKGEKTDKKSNGYIEHFNVRIKKNERNKLTRDNYCIPTNEIDYIDKKAIQKSKVFIELTGKPPLLCPSCYYDIPNDIFADEQHYTDEFVTKHYNDCMENFDLNMKYCEQLDYEKFDKYIKSFVKRNRFKEIFNLNELKEKDGIYILVLDEYKQAYIGKSISSKGVKGRILSHWSSKKSFSRLICGKVETSVLSIDSFGALDTTRIYFKEPRYYTEIDQYEAKYVENFKAEYRLNRVAGGLNSSDYNGARFLALLSTMAKRNLKE